jgi:tetratricopeptide (TPR) repeat protein
MNASKAIQSALENHQKGNLEQAEYLYKKILKKQPDNPDVLHMLGVLFCQRAQYDVSIKYIRQALQLRPSDLASAHCNLGVALMEKGQLDEAIAHYQKALDVNPLFGKAYCNLGNALRKKGQLDKAVTHCRKAIELNPSFDVAHYNLGNAFREKGLLDDAITYYQKAIELNPSFAKAHCNLGNALREKELLDEAITHCRKAIELNPSFAVAYYNLGSALREKGHLNEAVIHYQKAIELNPSFAKAHCNLGNVLREKGLLHEAVTQYQKALELDPSFDVAYCNLGATLQEKGLLDEAATHYQKAIELNPSSESAHFNLSLILLLSGNFKNGWKGYEWRWKTKDFVKSSRIFSKPVWDGYDIRGLTVLLECEQGLGDTIQFIRYAALLAQKGATVIVDCQRELAPLIKGVSGVHQIFVQGEELPEYDLYCPLLSLPRIFNTTLESIPSKESYIEADAVLARRWKEKVFSDNSSLKIGLVWAGKPTHKNDRNRSFPLATFSPLAALDHISFYSLQKGETAKQVENPPAGIHLIDYTEEFCDFADTAAFMENLDLVVSVDTSVVHLAGALGKPVWVLLPFVPDWRWMLDREDSPWYPTMKLFRQPSAGDWESVIYRVRDALMDVSANQQT